MKAGAAAVEASAAVVVVLALVIADIAAEGGVVVVVVVAAVVVFVYYVLAVVVVVTAAAVVVVAVIVAVVVIQGGHQHTTRDTAAKQLRQQFCSCSGPQFADIGGPKRPNWTTYHIKDPWTPWSALCDDLLIPWKCQMMTETMFFGVFSMFSTACFRFESLPVLNRATFYHSFTRVFQKVDPCWWQVGRHVQNSLFEAWLPIPQHGCPVLGGVERWWT